MYTISKKKKEGGESAFAEIIEKIFKEVGIKGVIVNSRIINIFRKKIGILAGLVKAASKKGGSSVKRLLNQWKGKTYDFAVFYHEVDKSALIEENRELKGQKRKLEESIVDEVAKRCKVQEKLQQALAKSEESCSYYKKRFKSLVRKVAKINRQAKRGPQKKKSFHDYTQRHQSRIRAQWKDHCSSTLSFLGLYDFIATKVEIYNVETQEYDTLQLIEEDELPLTESCPMKLNNEEIDDINFFIYIKDKFNISNEAWHELAMKTKKIPNTYKMNKRMSELNTKWKLKTTPGEAEGVQTSFCDSLKEQIARLENKGELKDDTTVKIKLSGDGTCIGKRLKVVNFTYTILNEKENAMSEKGNYLLAIVKTKETYDNLRQSLSDLKTEMAQLKEVKVNNANYNIEYFLGGDWKFLACVCGLGAANQDYACIWCKCPRNQRYDTSKTWSLTDKLYGARSCGEITKHSKTTTYNCKSTPLFDFIPIDHVIIDTLHLFLRVSDNLFELLIKELRRQDAIDKVKAFPNGINKEKCKHMASYQVFLQQIGISFEWKVEPNTKKLEYRDLTGPEKLCVFQHINFQVLLPHYKDVKELEKLWRDFIDIIGDLKLDFPTEESIKQLQIKLQSWFQQFLHLYQAKDVTPYMHAFYHHIPEFLRLYQNVAFFNQQGMEKYNDIASKDYFRSSNHRGICALEQLFLKKQRVQFLEGAGYERVKESGRCSNCDTQGHNIKTCTKPCKLCTYAVCCGHLEKVEKKWVQKCTLQDLA